jgi:iron complex outermembrane receptor protein
MHHGPQARGVVTLLGTASFLTIAGTLAAHAAAAPITAAPVEEVLITGSLIRGAPAVGVPVTALSSADFQETGSLTVSDLLKTVPSVTVQVTNAVTNGGSTVQKPQTVSIHDISTTSAPETLMMIDGRRFPIQGFGACFVDPSIIPQLAVDHIDVLADGASATYGSDAIAGVVNVILKRRFDGAISQIRYGTSWDIGNASLQASQLYGTRWDGGDLTLTYEWYHENNVRGPARDYFTLNFEPYGFDDRTGLGLAMPGVVSTGALLANPALAALGFSQNTGNRTCTNCFSIPNGTGWNYGDTPGHTNPLNPASAPTVTWTQLLANPGVKTLRQAAEVADIEPSQDHNSLTATFDQIVADNVFGVFRKVELFGEAFYSNRRAVFHYLPGASPAAQQAVRAQVVPTTNPYYPAGAPAGLRVSYNLGVEHDSRINAGEIAGRYAFGFNSDLPYDWNGSVFYSMSLEGNFVHVSNMVNANMIAAALGNTVASVPASGTIPGQAAFTKPANIPYLNVFCDATVFTCNAPATLAYIGAYRDYDTHWQQSEFGLNLNGPVFDLPGGTVRGAIGANAVSYHNFRTEHSNFSTPNTALPIVAPDNSNRASWAVFGQINVPIVGEMNKLPLVEALNIEAAYRLDHYNEFGSVSTPKLAATWNLGHGLALRGTLGKSFRAPAPAEVSETTGAMIQPINTGAGASQNTFALNCPAVPGLSTGTTANAGSLQAFLNPTCSTSSLLVNPAGITVSGGSGAARAIRTGVGIVPEKAKNWAVGFNFTPTEFLSGLNIDATWYHIRFDNLIGANSGGFNANDPASRTCTVPGPACLYLVIANPNLPITDPANAVFLDLVNGLLASPRSVVDVSQKGNIKFINDTATVNVGWREISGIDFDARYDVELGNFGAWNTGVTGTYRLKDRSQQLPELPVVDALAGNTGGMLRWRGRLGWTGEDGVSITGFVNYIPHGPVSATAPPNCFWAPGFGPGSCYPGSAYFGPYTVFPNTYPALYTFDLSFGYQTGTRPANPYLQNVNFQLTVLNLLNKAPPFNYAFGSARGLAAYVSVINEKQRYVSFAITKAW